MICVRIGSKHRGASRRWRLDMVVVKYGLLAQKRSLKDADNGWVNILTFPHAPIHSALTAISHTAQRTESR